MLAWAGTPSRLPVEHRLGTNTLITPFYEPARLSEDLATPDILSNGRLDVAFGSGSIGFEFETFRVDPRDRTGRMWETMEIVRRSFAEEEFDHHAKYFKIPHLRQTTKPLQDPFPIWYGGFGPKNLECAGREGYHVQAGPGAPVEHYFAGLQARGQVPEQMNVAIGGRHSMWSPPRRSLQQSASSRVCWRKSERRNIAPEGRDVPFSGAAAANRESAFSEPIVGTADQVLQALAPMFEKSPFTHLVLSILTHQIELFASEILPTLRRWGREPVPTSRRSASASPRHGG